MGNKKNLTQLCAKKAVKSFFSFRYKSFLTFYFSFFSAITTLFLRSALSTWILCEFSFIFKFFINFSHLFWFLFSSFRSLHFFFCIVFMLLHIHYHLRIYFGFAFFFVFRYFVFAYVIAEVQWDKCQKRVNARRENASDTFTARGGSRNSKFLMIHSIRTVGKGRWTKTSWRDKTDLPLFLLPFQSSPNNNKI